MSNFRNFLLVIAVLFLVANDHYASADFVSNGFSIATRYAAFSKTTKQGVCSGKLPYPELSNESDSRSFRINSAIYDFTKMYNICDVRNKNKFTVEYDIQAGSVDYFSIRWITKRGKKLYRINALNFNLDTGSLLNPKDILHPLSKNFLRKLIKLSGGNLSANTTWNSFLKAIERKQVQFYILNSEWHIVFNPKPGSNNIVVDTLLPTYLLKKKI